MVASAIYTRMCACTNEHTKIYEQIFNLIPREFWIGSLLTPELCLALTLYFLFQFFV
jgi:hypothetical protein